MEQLLRSRESFETRVSELLKILADVEPPSQQQQQNHGSPGSCSQTHSSSRAPVDSGPQEPDQSSPNAAVTHQNLSLRSPSESETGAEMGPLCYGPGRTGKVWEKGPTTVWFFEDLVDLQRKLYLGAPRKCHVLCRPTRTREKTETRKSHIQ
ncbi:unnamed protein product [Knipowitschia caucasica]|uniref:Uncharacterized protein n=1 Tax=Knipowitschia caucasica TaxID=637954 RepID=A0AAV2MN55_KNICA